MDAISFLQTKRQHSLTKERQLVCLFNIKLDSVILQQNEKPFGDLGDSSNALGCWHFMNLQDVHLFEDVDAVFRCQQHPTSNEQLMSQDSTMALGDLFIRPLQYLPLAKPIAQ